MHPHSAPTRNLRKKIRRPKTDEEFFEGTTPPKHARNISRSHDRTSAPSPSSSDDEVDEGYSSTHFRGRRVARYKGPVVQFNPNIPPARFLSSRERAERGDVEQTAGSGKTKDGSGATEARMNKRNAALGGTEQQPPRRGTENRPRRVKSQNVDGLIPDWLLPVAMNHDDKRSISDWHGAVNTHWRDMVDMASSSDDDERNGGATPKWSDIADEQKLDLLDSMGAIIVRKPDEDEDYYLERLMRRLRLTKPEREYVRHLILARHARRAEEVTALRDLQLTVHERIMAGSATKRKIDAAEYADILGEHLGHLIRTNDFGASTRTDSVAAKRYMRSCELDFRTLDEIRRRMAIGGKERDKSHGYRNLQETYPTSLLLQQRTASGKTFQPVTAIPASRPSLIDEQHCGHVQTAQTSTTQPNGVPNTPFSQPPVKKDKPQSPEQRPSDLVQDKVLSRYINTHYRQDHDVFMGSNSTLIHNLPPANQRTIPPRADELNASFRQAQSQAQAQAQQSQMPTQTQPLPITISHIIQLQQQQQQQPQPDFPPFLSATQLQAQSRIQPLQTANTYGPTAPPTPKLTPQYEKAGVGFEGEMDGRAPSMSGAGVSLSSVAAAQRLASFDRMKQSS